jgi:hypothetical protein
MRQHQAPYEAANQTHKICPSKLSVRSSYSYSRAILNRFGITVTAGWPWTVPCGCLLTTSGGYFWKLGVGVDLHSITC